MPIGPRLVTLWRRFMKYNVVGALGMALKLVAMFLLNDLAGVGYMTATALSVEASTLHNFVWHLRWTWGERSCGISAYEIGTRLLRFQCSNTPIALTLNLGLMRVLVGEAGMHTMTATIITTLLSGAVNFAISNTCVFTAGGAARRAAAQ